MEKCKTCVYWQKHINSKNGNCSLMPDTIITDGAYIDVYVSDDSGLDIKFITSPEFGCSLHKAKES